MTLRRPPRDESSRRGSKPPNAFERWILRLVLDALGHPPVTFVLWNGEEVRGSDEPSRARVHLRDQALLHQILHSPDLAFGEGYSDGRLELEGDVATVVELAEAVIYFASPRPGRLKHLVYPGVLNWEPFARFMHAYARVVTPSEHEVRALPDYVRCIWLQISVQRLEQNGPRPASGLEALQEVLALAEWASANAAQMIETSDLAIKRPS